MSHHKKRLHQLIHTLLQEDTPLDILQAADELFTLLADQAGLDEKKHSDHLKLATGTAIGPYWAAMCLQDFLRTQRFMRGILQAVSDVRKNNPDEQVHILYVGAGPFATLVLPLMARFTAKEISVSLLDVQEHVLDMQKKILKVVGFQDRVRAFIHADATTFQIKGLGKIHIVVAETMQHALEREPQVAITLNLAPQLTDDTVWIPQNIRIDAALMNIPKDAAEGETSHQLLARVFDLHLVTAQKMAARMAQKHPPLEAFRLDIPAQSAHEYPWLALLTEIHIYGEYSLHACDSALCAPRLLAKLTDRSSLPQAISFNYRMGENPGFDFTFQ